MVRQVFPVMRSGAFAYVIATALCAHAYALDMPTAHDPFATQKKLAPYGQNLKPAHCPAAPDTGKALALNDVVIATICHNPDARAAYLSLLASADGYDGTVMSYLPDVTASATGNSTHHRTDSKKSHARSSGISAQAGMTLYDFGRREATLEIAERSLAAAGLSYDSTLQGFIATSLQTYFRLLTSQNASIVAMESLGLAKASLEAAETRYQIGLVPLSDVLQARTSFSQAELNVEQTDNALTLDRAALAQLMGFPPLTAVQVAELQDASLTAPPFNSQLATLIEKAKAQRTDLKTRKLQLENAEDSLANTRRRGLPTISASASSGTNDWDALNKDKIRSDAIGVTVTIPIFTGFGTIFSERAQSKQLEAQRLQLTQSERDVEQDVLRSWQNYNTSAKSFEISKDALANARQLMDVSLGRYKEGLGSILDLMSAQVGYSNALQSHLSARYALLTTRVDLVRAVGALDLDTAQPPEASLPPLAAVVTYKDPIPVKEPAHEVP